MYFNPIPTFTLIAVVVSLALTGCGGNDGPVRMPLTGSVTSTDIKGELKGTIAVLPDGATKGPAANGLVIDGEYAFTSADGPVAGTHRVLIDVEPPRGKMDDVSQQSSLQWKFEFQITVPSEPPYTSDFILLRKKPDETKE